MPDTHRPTDFADALHPDLLLRQSVKESVSQAPGLCRPDQPL